VANGVDGQLGRGSKFGFGNLLRFFSLLPTFQLDHPPHNRAL
jgi:hypothetical protein